MSELNKMLSDLASPNHNESTLSVAPTPTAWRFRVARIAMILGFVVVLGSVAVWAVSGDAKEDAEQASATTQAPASVSPEKPAAQTVGMARENKPEKGQQFEAQQANAEQAKVAPTLSPTQKVVNHDNDYVVRTQAVQPKPEVIEPTKPKAVEKRSVSKPVEEKDTTTAIAAVKPAPVNVSAAPVKVEPVRAEPVKATPPVAKTVVVSESNNNKNASLIVETVELSGPELAAIAYEKAQKRAQIGDTKQAIAFLKDAVNYHPNHVAAVNQLAGMLYGRNQIRDAENVLRSGIKANPESASLKLTLARIYQQNNREESALNVLLEPVYGRSVDDIRMVSMRAGLAQKLGNHAEAQNSYLWLTKVEPEQGRWWLGSGVSAERTGDYAQAKQSYEQAIDAGGLSNQSMQFARQRLVYLNSAKGADNGH
ncbi:tetratricopeptide repeat protein [Enterovibrio coralii]|uniref:Uncharacterized protein n=1 Tax=Enterovibrio coralii TaxID=294935 RepID=A0A135I3K9_9GAMM|nr:tetratricopeptide repeat protein [Enterovibrio coralii]KXF80027.1 hypothetical protein ATN88_13405 [Enterovibrio coralii]